MGYNPYSMTIDLSWAITKLQRVKSIVVPRVNAGGFPFFPSNSFTFEMKQLHFIFALGYFMCLQKVLAKKCLEKLQMSQASFYNSCFLLSECRDLPLSLHVICNEIFDNLKNNLIAQHIIKNR